MRKTSHLGIGVLTFLVGVLMGNGVCGESATEVSGSRKVSFHKEIRPIFQRECHGCHQPAKNKGEYVMTRFDALIAGGESDEAAIIAGQPEKSLLLQQITPVDGEAEMPPNKSPPA
ncbi:MAG: hypothetical protein LR011_07830 [Verrucomicrobia bacterium]|nr:hypothetical protein [Verrucomicrobiota bacterium]